jgi:hypothetical protein
MSQSQYRALMAERDITIRSIRHLRRIINEVKSRMAMEQQMAERLERAVATMTTRPLTQAQRLQVEGMSERARRLREMVMADQQELQQMESELFQMMNRLRQIDEQLRMMRYRV